MVFSEERSFARWFIIVASLAITLLFLWNISIFFDRIKEEEQAKMEVWVSAYSEIINSSNDTKFSETSILALENNTSTPMIEYSVKDDSYNTRNIPLRKVENNEEIKILVEEFKSQYEPIEISDEGELLTVIYYGNSELLNKLKYFPIGIIFVVILFLALLYYFYATSKSNEQSKLWAGMAKETAHQIGTPLSSLVGWTEILKNENVQPSYLEEIEKDIFRLQTITERFSKIGSLPKLEPTNIVAATENSYEYLKVRTSKLINFSLEVPSEEIIVQLNEQLYSWTIENLVKNSIDALRGKGEIHLEIADNTKWVHIYITDNGKGMPKSKFNKIFEPGYTSKKRGWGLGLSLAKRIIEEYHDGKIKVLKSELGKGTTFEIKLKKT